jgi:lipopolysaccharide/colanic/teichoic acid biosynthesis glycosyltransferase
MSFVGPRALLPIEIETGGDHLNANGYHTHHKIQHIRDIPGYEERIRVVPGLTGIAQIYAPRDLPRRHKFKYDLLYIRNMSFGTDIKLIMMSFLISFSGTWEKRGAKLRALERHDNGPLRGRD